VLPTNLNIEICQRIEKLVTAQLYFWLRFKERQKDNLANLAPTLIKRDL